MQKGGKDLDLRTLSKKHAFGVKADVYGCIHWLQEENSIAYPVGRNVVSHNIQNNQQKFFLSSDKTDAITAIALSPNKRYIAIAESGEHPQIQIVEVSSKKRRRVLNVTDLGSNAFVCMEFSADGRHLVTQGGAPHWHLLYWNWERSKPLSQVAITRDQTSVHAARDNNMSVVTKISINPRDPLMMVVSGNAMFRFYRYVDNLLKVAPGGLGKAGTQNFTTHAWITEERIVVATDNAELLLLEDCEFKCPLAAAPVGDGNGITAIEPTQRGFVCGGDAGMLHIFEQTDDKEMYRRVRSLSIEPKIKELGDDHMKRGTIRAFSLTPGEDMLAMVTSNLQIFGLPFNQDFSKVEAPTFLSICQPAHAGSINGLDACIRKPLVATCSSDCSVRIWNIIDHTVEIIKHFHPHEPIAVSMHPSGLHILVAFTDRVKLMNLYGDDIVEFKSFTLRQVTDVRFSVGGQLFAVVHSTHVNIYNTYTCEAVPVGSLRGHTQKIRSLQWASTCIHPLDTRVVSCALDGMIIDYTIKDMRKDSDHTDKKYQYHAVASDQNHIWAVATSASSQQDQKWRVKLRELEVAALHAETVMNDYEIADAYLTTLTFAPQHRLLLGGCQDGSVKLMTFPLQGGIMDPPFLAHAGAVTRMALSFDEQMLFTAGADGSFYIFDVKEEGRPSKKEMQYADEILISKAALEEKNTTTNMLKQTVDDINLDMDYQEKRRGVQHDERVKELTNHFHEEAEKQARRFQAEYNAKLDQERTFAETKQEEQKRHSEAKDKLEKEMQKELKRLDDLCQDRKAQLDRDKADYADQIKAKDKQNAAELQQIEELHTVKLTEQEELINGLRNKVQRNKDTYDQTQQQLEADTMTEIDNVRKKYSDAVDKEREKFLHMKGEHAIMKKNALMLGKEIDNKRAEIDDLEDTKNGLMKRIREYTVEIDSLHKDIDDRDTMIADRERKIYELKKKNQDLEKHKFVLDHRIRQLKGQIEPKQTEIAREKARIKDKDQELEQCHRNNLALRGHIEDLNKSIERQGGEIKKLLNHLKDFETYKRRVKSDVGELAQKVQDPEELREGIVRIFKEHVERKGGQRAAALEPHLKGEFHSHTDYLSRTVASLKRKVGQDQTAHKQEISGVMAENLRLIGEIHELRKHTRWLRNNMTEGDASSQPAPPSGPNASAARQDPNSSANNNNSISAATLAQTQMNAKEMENNRQEIQRLRSKIQELEKSLAIRAARPPSRDKLLPPIGQKPGTPSGNTTA